MKKQLKNKLEYAVYRKILISAIVLIIAIILLLMGSFAWNVKFKATAAGSNYSYNYLVLLKDEDSTPLYVNNNWKKGELIRKEVYATSSYLNEKIKVSYDTAVALDPEIVFSDTWVRIKIKETLTIGFNETTMIADTVNIDGQLLSAFSDYFELINDDDQIKIIPIEEWTGKKGRFWILDTDGWLYWAQPLKHTDDTNTEDVDQVTDHIIDQVKLTKQPRGIFSYVVTAVLEAMDVELDGYHDENVWEDVDVGEPIYRLFEIKEESPSHDEDGNLLVNEYNFPDSNFRKYINSTSVDKNRDGVLSQTEINAMTVMNINSKAIKSLVGVEHFPNIIVLYAATNSIPEIDLSGNTILQELSISNSKIEKINLSNNKKLKKVYLQDNYLTELDLSNNENLTILNVARNNLKKLDVSNVISETFTLTCNPQYQEGTKIEYYLNTDDGTLIK